MSITLYESLRGLFYTPYYASLARGAYAQEGLDVSLARPESPAFAAADLLSGKTDVTWGGPMRMMQSLNKEPDCGIVAFGEAITRDPFYLVGRRPNPDFRFADLRAVKLAHVSEVPTPWMCLQDDIRRAGIDPNSLDLVTDGGMGENADALRAGKVDVIQVFEPFVEQLVSEGAGHIWYTAANRGPTSYTTFYTIKPTLARERDTMLRMTRALYRTQKWLHASSADTLAETVARYFPDLSHATLAGAIGRYQGTGIWGRDPILPIVGFVRLKAALLSGAFIQRDVPFHDCVDNSLAEQVIAENPPSL